MSSKHGEGIAHPHGNFSQSHQTTKCQKVKKFGRDKASPVAIKRLRPNFLIRMVIFTHGGQFGPEPPVVDDSGDFAFYRTGKRQKLLFSMSATDFLSVRNEDIFSHSVGPT